MWELSKTKATYADGRRVKVRVCVERFGLGWAARAEVGARLETKRSRLRAGGDKGWGQGEAGWSGGKERKG